MLKCPIYVDFIIITITTTNNNKELMRDNFLGFHCHNNGVIQTHSYNSQRKVRVQIIGTKSPTEANTDHHNGDLK